LEVYLALRSAVGEIEGGEDYSNKAEESMGLFYERMSISLVSSNDSSLEDLVPNDLHRGGMEELLEQSLQKWKYNLEEWKRDNEELPTTDQAQIWRLLRAATDGNRFDVAWDLWARQHYTTRRGKAVDTRVLQWAWRTRQSSKF